MSGSGRPTLPPLDGSGLRIGTVASRWHARVMTGLIAGTERGLLEAGVTDTTLVRVPGCFEVPIVARELALSGYDAVVALGVIVRGGTPHFDYVCRAVTDGLTRVALDTGVPMGFGVLTCDTDEQAFDRAGLARSREDKGNEAAQAAVATSLTLKGIRGARA